MAMRKISLAVLALSLLAACDQKTDNKVTTDLVTNTKTANGESNAPLAVISFERDTFNFGEVLEGEMVSYSYRFTNTGTNDLVISGATGSCGCTVPTYPKKPIRPGEQASIDVVFDSNNRRENQIKTVSISANTEPAISKVTLVGYVKPKI